MSPESSAPRPARSAPRGSLGALPFWAIALGLGLLLAFALASGDESALRTMAVLRRGLWVTVRITLVAFALALLIGVAVGLGRISRRAWLRQLCTLYVELVRGIPMLVLLLWFGYAFAPWLAGVLRELLLGPLQALAALGGPLSGLFGALAASVDACARPSDCLSLELRGILGLAVGYGAYLAEVVRAGIESVPAGQTEAAYSVGMTRRQALRYVVMPQALRLALPPLGNDFIALLKDSALVSVLAVPEMTYEARLHVSRTFQALGVWNLVALFYLVLTLSLSAGVHWLERRTSWGPDGRHGT